MNRIEKALMYGLFLHLHHNTDKALNFAAFKRLNEEVTAAGNLGKLLIGPDANDDAGVIGIGSELIVGKLESHCSPSAVDPYNSSGTGVSGSCRDVVGMGGRPLAISDFIGTMPLEQEVLVGPCAFKGQCSCGNCTLMSSRERTDLMLSGLRDMASALGVYVIGGGFSTSFRDVIPAVVIAVIGQLVTKKPLTKPAKRIGDKLVLIGKTGTDGNDTLFRAGAVDKMRPAIALFAEERATMDACLKVFTKHESSISACSDLGAAGLGAAVCESVRYGGLGARVNLAYAPLKGSPNPEEILVCETQARMLMQINPMEVEAILDTLRQSGVSAAVIGEITDDKDAVFIHKVQPEDNATLIATIPNELTEVQLAELKA